MANDEEIVRFDGTIVRVFRDDRLVAEFDEEDHDPTCACADCEAERALDEDADAYRDRCRD